MEEGESRDETTAAVVDIVDDFAKGNKSSSSPNVHKKATGTFRESLDTLSQKQTLSKLGWRSSTLDTLSSPIILTTSLIGSI